MDFDRLEEAREQRSARKTDFAPVPAPKAPRADYAGQKAFQDFRPPPTIHRPGLDRVNGATPKVGESSKAGMSSQFSTTSTALQSEEVDDYSTFVSPDGKRKRAELQAVPNGDSNGLKRQAAGPSGETRSNPFARKPGADANRNPFNRTAEMNKSLHKSESFFTKVDQAEVDKTKRGLAAGKGKKKDAPSGGRQTTLFGLPTVAPPDKKSAGRKRKTPESQETLSTDAGESQATVLVESSQPESESQLIGIESETQLDDPISTAVTEVEESTQIEEDEGSPEPIEWPPSPQAGASMELDSEMVDVAS